MNLRLQYLKSIGLNFDPFELTAAEQEVETRDNIPEFFNYLCLPKLKAQDGNELTFRSLRQPEHLFVFAEPGMGKTTLKLQVNADCRSLLDDKTMTVIYDFGDESALSDEEYGNRLAKALTTDLFIHIVEQFWRFKPRPSKNQLSALAAMIPVGGIRLRMLLERLLEDQDSSSHSQLGVHWAMVGRNAVRIIPPSARLHKMLQTIKEKLPGLKKAPMGWDAVMAGIKTAQQWGFINILILFDGLDALHRDPDAMLSLLRPVLQRLAFCEKHNVFAKLFLPLEVKNKVQDLVAQINLFSPPVNATIIWDKKRLSNLVKERLRVAGMAESDLNLFASEELPEIHHRVIEMACGSPRQLLQIVSALIDSHIKISHNSSPFLRQDWSKMERTINFQRLISCQERLIQKSS